MQEPNRDQKSHFHGLGSHGLVVISQPYLYSEELSFHPHWQERVCVQNQGPAQIYKHKADQNWPQNWRWIIFQDVRHLDDKSVLIKHNQTVVR